MSERSFEICRKPLIPRLIYSFSTFAAGPVIPKMERLKRRIVVWASDENVRSFPF